MTFRPDAFLIMSVESMDIGHVNASVRDQRIRRQRLLNRLAQNITKEATAAGFSVSSLSTH